MASPETQSYTSFFTGKRITVVGLGVLGRGIGRIEADLEGFARDLLDLLADEPGRAPRSTEAD